MLKKQIDVETIQKIIADLKKRDPKKYLSLLEDLNKSIRELRDSLKRLNEMTAS